MSTRTQWAKMSRLLFLRPLPETIQPYDLDLLIVSLTLGAMAEGFRERRDSKRAQALENACAALWELRLDGCEKPSIAFMDSLWPDDAETLRELVKRQSAHWERVDDIVCRVLAGSLEASRRKKLSAACLELKRTYREVAP